MAQSLYRQASLIMNPYGAKDDLLPSIKPTNGDGDFTFSRDGSGASPATRVNASGLIEKGRENVLLQSNQFDTTWSLVNANLTSGQSGYDGSSNAWLLSVAATTGSTASVRQTTSITAVSTFSVYAKAGNVNFAALYCSSSGSDFNAWFDLGNGVLGSTAGGTIDTTIESVGGGWYRISITGLSPDSQVRIYPSFANSNYSITSGENIYIQDAQLEQGLVATDYIETTTTAVSAGLLGDMPRLDYSGGATCPSLLLEPSRVNSVPFSEYYGGSAWTKANVALTDNSATSPEGVTNAAKLAENTSGNNLYAVFEQFTPSLGTYTFSGFMKKGTLRYGGIRAIVNAGANRFFVNADLETGVIVDTDVVGTGVTWSYDIEDYGNGWYRLWISGAHSIAGFVDLSYALSDSATPTYTSALPTYSASGSDYNYIYGAQIESGSYPTSYIPTYGSASTRGADSMNVTSATDIIGQTEGTMFVEYDQNLIGQSATRRIMALTDGGILNRIVVYVSSSNKIDFYVRNSSGNLFLGTSTNVNTKGVHKIAAAYKDGDYVVYLDGTQIISGAGTAGTIPACNRIDVGSQIGANPLDEPIKQTLLFKTRLTNAELAALTA